MRDFMRQHESEFVVSTREEDEIWPNENTARRHSDLGSCAEAQSIIQSRGHTLRLYVRDESSRNPLDPSPQRSPGLSNRCYEASGSKLGNSIRIEIA